MILESRVHALTDKFRISKTGFEVPIDQEIESGIRPNPESNINSLGSPVSDITLFVFGDTHYHIPEKTTFDRTAILPTTKLFNIIRRHTGQRVQDWHKEVRPKLYNESLFAWPQAVESFFATGSIQPTESAIIIHTGDIGDDALNKRGFATGIKVTQGVISDIEKQFLTAGQATKVQFIQALGNHDVDFHAWTEAERTRQIQWVYKVLGIEQNPACFLQEIKEQNETVARKGILILDTNLLEDAWVREVKRVSMRALSEIQRQTILPTFPLESELKDPVFQKRLLSVCTSDKLLALSSDVLLYPRILQHITTQNKLIQHARRFEEVTIIGHKQKETLEVAKICEGKATIIASHRHVAYNSERNDTWFHLQKPKTQSKQPIRTLLVGAPTVGGLGIEIPTKPMGFMLRIDAQGRDLAHKDIYEISTQAS